MDFCESSGKIKYNSRSEAQFEAAKIQTRRGDEALNTFFCDSCGAYHIGRPRPFGRPLDGKRHIEKTPRSARKKEYKRRKISLSALVYDEE